MDRRIGGIWKLSIRFVKDKLCACVGERILILAVVLTVGTKLSWLVTLLVS